MKEVVIAGNPNSGKTTLFNALTKSRLKTGNFHGVTCSPASKRVGDIIFTDVPGAYSLDEFYTGEEASAAQRVRECDIIINVVDALSLESSLRFTKKLKKVNPKTVVYLTKTAKLERRGGKIDKVLLSRFLGLPVFDCPPKELLKAIEVGDFSFSEREEKIDLNAAYAGGNSDLTRAERLFYDRRFACFFFFAVMAATFFITFQPHMPGAYLKGLTENAFENLSAFLYKRITSPALSSFVCEWIAGGVGGVLSFIPQITLLYLSITLLEESGAESALSFATDGLFEKVGLSGRAAFTLVSGFGCTAAAIATTRGYTNGRARERAVATLPFIPCGAKTPVFLTFLSPLFKNPFPAICALYFAGILLAVSVSALLKGEREGLICEVAPIVFPDFLTVVKKLFFCVKSFIIKVATAVFIFCVISWLLSHFSLSGYCAPQDSLLGDISRIFTPLFYPMGITDWRIAYAAATGFAAKENIAATIATLIPEGLSLGLSQSIPLCIFFLCCPACVSAFASSIREIGTAKTIKYNLCQLAFAFAAAYAAHFLIIFI